MVDSQRLRRLLLPVYERGAVESPVTLILDSFTGVDDDDLNIHDPDTYPVGSAWLDVSGSLSISGNKARCRGVSAGFYVIDAGENDLRLEVDVTFVAWVTKVGFVVRYQDASNHLLFYVDDSRAYIVEVVTGTPNTLANDLHGCAVGTIVLCVRTDGAALRLDVYSGELLKLTLLASTSNMQSATCIGLVADTSSSDEVTFDDLLVTTNP